MPTTPFVLAIQLNQAGGSGRGDAIIQVYNATTDEVGLTTTNSSGQALFDLANFDKGYHVDDLIQVTQIIDEDDIEFFVTSNNDKTYPTWVQVDDEIRTKIPAGTARIKLNTERHAGSYDLKITKN